LTAKTHEGWGEGGGRKGNNMAKAT